MIDTHIHLTNYAYNDTFSLVALDREGFVLKHGNRAEMVRLFKEAGVKACIEPAIEFDSNIKIMDLAEQYPDFVFPAVGVHPTRTRRYFTVENGVKLTKSLKLLQRKELERMASSPNVVAIGETGLDYHLERNDQYRLIQIIWFVWQIKLADKHNLPLILHIRDADRDALHILHLYRRSIHSGVYHCFSGGPDLAKKYIDLGLMVGIGGMLLSKHAVIRNNLEETVMALPLENILLETDGPYVKPDCPDISNKQLRKARNTSLILPCIASRIAELKGVTQEDVERITTENALRVFDIQMETRK